MIYYLFLRRDTFIKYKKKERDLIRKNLKIHEQRETYDNLYRNLVGKKKR